MKPVVLLLIVMLFIACKKDTNKKYAITKIEFATGDCFGPCQHTAITIESSHKYQFYAGSYPDFAKNSIFVINKKGYYIGTVSERFWDSLNAHLNKINYSKLDSSYQGSADDQSLELIIHYSNKIKHIKAQTLSLPINVRNVFNEIANSYKAVNLRAIKQPIKFETTYQQNNRSRFSNSVSVSKKLKTFICEYNVNGKKINGHSVLAVFAEKEHTINDFGVCDIINTESRLVVVFKANLINDNFLSNYGHTWKLSESNYLMAPWDKFILYYPQSGTSYPNTIRLLCTTHLNPRHDDQLLLTKDLEDDHKEVPIKTNITFYKVK